MASQENMVYEYFKVCDVYINGRFRDYVDRLWVKNTIQESMVKRLVDIYAIAAVVGLAIGSRLEDDHTGGDKRTVQLAQLAEAQQTLNPIMKLVLMLDESRNLSEEERIHSAFRVPETREEHDKNMELFHSYVRGGIEYMYQQLVVRQSDRNDEYSDERINRMIAFLKKPLQSDML